MDHKKRVTTKFVQKSAWLLPRGVPRLQIVKIRCSVDRTVDTAPAHVYATIRRIQYEDTRKVHTLADDMAPFCVA